ncbi:hypothetical protein PR202_ga11058 [Eleusine coracana subsp. coracana]|uniref:Uncharacterized protein n=1 Tax=Eleusine coracana subsp. coracana TaxID=191504 RepID=A0AAV5C828_ELECO|nr:hypothetical protein PR202_ga11058 [Eleusine coracana subsp. coracana]
MEFLESNSRETTFVQEARDTDRRGRLLEKRGRGGCRRGGRFIPVDREGSAPALELRERNGTDMVWAGGDRSGRSWKAAAGDETGPSTLTTAWYTDSPHELGRVTEHESKPDTRGRARLYPVAPTLVARSPLHLRAAAAERDSIQIQASYRRDRASPPPPQVAALIVLLPLTSRALIPLISSLVVSSSS